MYSRVRSRNPIRRRTLMLASNIASGINTKEGSTLLDIEGSNLSQFLELIIINNKIIISCCFLNYHVRRSVLC